MRLYLKLIVAVVLFVAAARIPARDLITELAFDVRVAAVSRFGNADDFERLVDDTQRRLATERGELAAYEAGKRFQSLFDERLALATCTDGPLRDDDVTRIREQCSREVFTPAALAAMSAPRVPRDPAGLQRPCTP